MLDCLAMNRPRWRRWLRRLGALALVIALVLVGIGTGCADGLILVPPRGAIDARGASRQAVPVGSSFVEVWTARSAAARESEPRAFVLEFTGNATRAEQIATFVAARFDEFPVEAWVMNYPGYGGSPAPKRMSGIPPAALAAYDALRRRAGDKPVFVEANSLGTTAALHVAANRPVAGLILQNPIPLRQLLLGRFGWWNLWLIAGPAALQVPSPLDSSANARRCTAPAVFLLADQDELVTPEYHRKITDVYGGPKYIITLRGAGHNDSVTGEAERELHEQIRVLWNQTSRAAR